MKVASDLELKKRTNLRSQLFLMGKYWNLLATGKTTCKQATSDTPRHMVYHPNSAYHCDIGTNEEYTCQDCGLLWLLEIPTET